MFKIRFLEKLLVVLFVAVAVASCGGGGGSGGGSSSNSEVEETGVIGKAIKGAINGGIVICYDEYDKELSRTKTKPDGSYKFKQQCPSRGKLVVRGGTDESTGETLEELIASGDSLYITPVTTMEYVTKKYKIELSDKDSIKLIKDAKKNDPADKTKVESKKLLKMAVTLHSMVKNLQQQSNEDLSYEDAMTVITDEMRTQEIKKLADDNKKEDAKKLVKKVFDDLEQGGQVKIPAENRKKIDKILDQNSAKLQQEDLKKGGLKDFVPKEFIETQHPSRYVRISKEELNPATGKFDLKFVRNLKYAKISALKYECKTFTKGTGKSFTFRANWNSGLPVAEDCTLDKQFSVDESKRDQFLVVKYYSSSDSAKYSYSAPHRIGSMASLGNRDELKFDNTVYLPISNSYATKTIGIFDTSLSGAETGLETGNNKMGYLPIGFYYKPTQIPTARFRNVSFGVKLQIGKKDLVMMVDNLYIKENSLKSDTNPYLHNVGDNLSGLFRSTSVYHHNVDSKYIRQILSDLIPSARRFEYHTKKGFLRFKKPTEIDDVLLMNNQTAIDSNDSLVGVDLASLCNRPISQARVTSGAFTGTLCDYIRSTINVQQAKSVVITPFIKSTEKLTKGENLFKTNQSDIVVNGVAGYKTFPSITIKGEPVSKDRLIAGKTGLQGVDSDGDGVSDYDEMTLGRDPFSDSDIDNDKDGDGLSDRAELELGLDPKDAKDKISFVVNKNQISIIEGSTTQQPFDVTISGPNSVGKFVNITFEGKAENIVTLDVSVGTDITVAGTKTINITPKNNFVSINSSRIVITAKITKNSVVKTFGVKNITINVSRKKSLTPAALDLSYKTSASGGSVITTLSKSNFFAGVEISASPTVPRYKPSGATVVYEWEDSSDGTNWVAISGATASKYIVKESDIGKFIRVSVVYKEAGKAVDWGLKLSRIAKNSSGMVMVYPIAPTRIPILTSDEKINDKFYNESVITMSMATKSGYNISYKWKSRATSVAPNNVWSDITGEASRTYTVPAGTPIGTQYQGCYAYTKNGTTSAYICSTTNATVEIAPRSFIEFKNDNNFASTRVRSYTIKTDGNTMGYYRNDGSIVDSALYILVKLPYDVSTKIDSTNANVVISDGTASITVPASNDNTEDNIFYASGKNVAVFKLPAVSVLKSAKTYTIKSVLIPGYSYDLPKSVPTLSVKFGGWISGKNIGATLDSNTRPYRRFAGDKLQAQPIALTVGGLSKLYKWQAKSANSNGDCSTAVNNDVGWIDIATTSANYTIKNTDDGKCVRVAAALQINGEPAKPTYKAKNIETAAVVVVPATPTTPATLGSDQEDNKLHRLSVVTMVIKDKQGYSVSNYKWRDNTSGKFVDIANAKKSTYQVPSNFAYGKKILGCYSYKRNNTNVLSGYKCMTEANAMEVEERTIFPYDKSKIGNWNSKKDILMYFNRLNNRLYVAVATSAVPKVARNTVPRLEILPKDSLGWGNKDFVLSKDNSSRCSVTGKFSLPAGYDCLGYEISRNYFKPGGQIKVRWAEYLSGKKISGLNEYSGELNIDSFVIRLLSPTTVSIDGKKRLGKVLTANHTGNILNATAHYSWQSASNPTGSSWTDIASGVANTYTLKTSDVGRFIRVKVRYEKTSYIASDWVESAPSGKIYHSGYSVPPEASTSANVAEWGTDITVTTVPGQEYKIVTTDGSPVPSHITYDHSTGKIRAISSGVVKLQTRVGATADVGESDWTAGQVIEFIRKKSPVIFNLKAAVAPNTQNNQYRYYNHKDFAYSNIGKQIVTMTVHTASVTSKKLDEQPWLILKNNPADIVYSFNVTYNGIPSTGLPQVIYIRKPVKANLTLHFARDGLYEAKSINVALEAGKDYQSAPSSPIVDKATVKWNEKVKITNKSSSQQYRIIGTDGSSPAPSHITYDNNLGVISASASGAVLIQSRNPEKANYYPSDWVSKRVEFKRLGVPTVTTTYLDVKRNDDVDLSTLFTVKSTRTQAIQYNEVTDTNSIASATGPVVTISNSASGGQFAIYTIKFVADDKYIGADVNVTLNVKTGTQAKPSVEATTTVVKAEWGTAITVATVAGQDYQIVATDGSPAPSHITYDHSTGKIRATSPGVVKLQTRMSATIDNSESDWTAGKVIEIIRKKSPVIFNLNVVTAPYVASENRKYRYYEHRDFAYSNIGKQTVTMTVHTASVTHTKLDEKPWSILKNNPADIVYSLNVTHLGKPFKADPQLIYVRKGMTADVTLHFAKTELYEAKSINVVLEANKDYQSLPSAPRVDKATVKWTEKVTIKSKSKYQEYRIIGADGSSPAPSHITYDNNLGVISASASGVVLIQTRKLEKPIYYKTAWVSKRVEFEKLDLPTVPTTDLDVKPNDNIDLSTLFTVESTRTQAIQYNEATDTNSIASANGSVVTIAKSASGGQFAIYTIKFVENDKYVGAGVNVTLNVKIGTQAKPSIEATTTVPNAEWGTAITVVKVAGQDYRIVATDGSPAPSHITYDDSTGEIRATSSGIVKLQTRKSRTLVLEQSDWTDGATVEFTATDSPAQFALKVAVAPGDTSKTDTYKVYTGSHMTYSNPGKQVVSMTVHTASVTGKKVDKTPWNDLNYNIVYSFNPKLIYVRKGTTADVTFHFATTYKYKAKSINARLVSLKDTRSTPSAPTVDRTSVEWTQKVKITNKSSSLEYRIVATDGGAAPSHITYDNNLGVISASSAGVVLVQTRKPETARYSPTSWVSTRVEFEKIALPTVKTNVIIDLGYDVDLSKLFTVESTRVQDRRYTEETDSNNIGTLNGTVVTILKSASTGQFADYKIRFVENSLYKGGDFIVRISMKTVQPKPVTEATASSATSVWGTDITVATVSGQDYRIVAADGSTPAPNYISYNPNTGVISSAGVGVVKLQTRMAETAIFKPSVWTDGVTITFTKATSPGLFSMLVTSAPGITSAAGKTYKYYKHTDMNYSNSAKQVVTMTVNTANVTSKKVDELPWSHLGTDKEDIIYSFNVTSGGKPTSIPQLIYVRRGITADVTIHFAENSLYKAKSINARLVSLKNTTPTPTAPTVDRASVLWTQKVKITNKSSSQEYRIVDADGSSPAPSHITYDDNSQIISASYAGVVLVQTRIAETPTHKPSAWVSTRVEFEKIALPFPLIKRYVGVISNEVVYLSTLFTVEATRTQAIQYTEASDPNGIASQSGINNEKVTISPTISIGQSATYTINFVEDGKYKGGSFDVELRKKLPAKTQPKSEATASLATAEWGTDITVTTVAGQDYRVVALDGSKPIDFVYNPKTWTISASATGAVKLQTRIAETATEFASAWTAGTIITFSRKTPIINANDMTGHLGIDLTVKATTTSDGAISYAKSPISPLEARVGTSTGIVDTNFDAVTGEGDVKIAITVATTNRYTTATKQITIGLKFVKTITSVYRGKTITPRVWSGYMGKAKWADAKTSCENLVRFGKKDWRLATFEELKVLTYVRKVGQKFYPGKRTTLDSNYDVKYADYYWYNVKKGVVSWDGRTSYDTHMEASHYVCVENP